MLKMPKETFVLTTLYIGDDVGEGGNDGDDGGCGGARSCSGGGVGSENCMSGGGKSGSVAVAVAAVMGSPMQIIVLRVVMVPKAAVLVVLAKI